MDSLSIGGIADFEVELEYSEYRDGYIVVIFKNEAGVDTDTIYGDALKVTYKRLLTRTGPNVLKGTLFEVYGEGEFGGNRYFEYKYQVN